MNKEEPLRRKLSRPYASWIFTQTGWWLLPVLILTPLFLADAAPVDQPGGDWAKRLQPLQHAARQVAIQVVSLPDRRLVSAHQANRRLIPASLLKILVSYAALKELGSYHHFTTEVWSRQVVRDGVLAGDIWIKGSGDPFLVPEKLYLLGQKIREAGIHRIDGGIGVDNGYLRASVEKICLDGQCDRAYNPVITATTLDFNTLTLQLRPSSRPGVTVEVFPHGDYAVVDNQVGRGDAQAGETGIQVHSAGVTADGRERYRLTGSLAAKSAEAIEVRVNVNDPVSFFARSLKCLLGEIGVEVRGGILPAGSVPSGARKLTEYTSPPLKDILYGLNRYSNNFMAELLLRVLGAEIKGLPGSAEKGLEVLGETLAALGVPGTELELDGGSGLSRRCRVSAQALCSVLVAAYHDPEIGPEFMASLATGGEEGTLRRRGKRLTNPASIRGKTGSLSDVLGFAGYVGAAGGGTHAVVIMLNEVHKPAEAKAAIDRFLSWFAGIRSSGEQ